MVSPSRQDDLQVLFEQHTQIVHVTFLSALWPIFQLDTHFVVGPPHSQEIEEPVIHIGFPSSNVHNLLIIFADSDDEGFDIITDEFVIWTCPDNFLWVFQPCNLLPVLQTVH